MGQLSAIDVKGGKKDDKVIFYTSLYRAYLSPADVSSPDGAYLGTDGKVYISEDFRYYSNWSLWDTFRTKFPLLVLTEPARMRDMATSLIHLYATGKKDWSTGFRIHPDSAHRTCCDSLCWMPTGKESQPLISAKVMQV